MRTRNLRDEAGFTLIELLVVIIIIGILAAIAIPIFIGQRSKAYDGEAKSDLRELAGAEELYLTDFDRYGLISAIQATEPRLKLSAGVTLTVIRYNTDQGFCISAHHSSSAHTWYWDSSGGGMQAVDQPCLVTTTGTAGDSVSG